MGTIYLGEILIYQNQMEAGEELFQKMMKSETPVLAALPQMGKTGAMIYAMHQVIMHCQKNNIEKFQIIFALNDSNKDVRDQTSERIEKSFTDNPYKYTKNELFYESKKDRKILVIHRDDYKKYKDLDSNKIYFRFFDEAHIALNEGGSVDELQKNKSPKTYDALCSATPFAYQCKHSVMVPLKISDSYYGIFDYEEAGRIKQTPPLFNKSGKFNPDCDVYEMMKDFVETFRRNGSGHIIARVKNASAQELQSLCDWVGKQFKINCDYKEYNSHKKNIDNINVILSEPPKKDGSIDLRFLFIKASLRVGKTINKEFIRGMIDTAKSSTGATSFQSLMGRASGYNLNNFDFCIYTDPKEVNLYRTWWEEINSKLDPSTLPSSRYNSSTKSSCKFTYYMSSPGEFKSRPSDSEIEKYMKKNNLPFHISGYEIIPRLLVKVTSKNTKTPTGGNDNDMALSIINGSARSTRSSYDDSNKKYISGVYLDKSSKDFPNSWNKVMNKGFKPGEFVLFFPTSIVTAKSKEELLTLNCFLRNM